MGASTEEPSTDLETADPTGEQSLLSRIPQMAGGERVSAMKADYLGWRACGFPVKQACHLADMSLATLRRYRQSDPAFAVIENERLPELQSSVASDLVRLEFMRNMRMAMRADHQVLYKAVHCMESLTPREFSYLKKVRGLYGPQDLATMSKALSPGSGEPTDFAEMVLKLTQTRTELEVSIAPKLNADSEEVPTLDAAEYKEV